MYNDKTLVCKDCGQEFTFTAREQEFYAEKGFTNEPRAAKPAVTHAKSRRGPRQMYDAVCARCGKACQVPFEPHGDVLCDECFKEPDNNEKARSALFSFSVNTHCMSQTPIRLFFSRPAAARQNVSPEHKAFCPCNRRDTAHPVRQTAMGIKVA